MLSALNVSHGVEYLVKIFEFQNSYQKKIEKKFESFQFFDFIKFTSVFRKELKNKN